MFATVLALAGLGVILVLAQSGSNARKRDREGLVPVRVKSQQPVITRRRPR